jgi:ubiquinol-cytochrome c reductase cytochrome b subunit
MAPPQSSFWQDTALDRSAQWLSEVQLRSDSLSLTRFSGSLALALIVILVISGAFMSLYYTPAPDIAYDSLDYAQYKLPFGEMIRGVHHWAWNLLLLVLILHILRGFWVAAYMAGRQWVWVSGALIFLLLPVFLITGDLLPWDQKGYWTTQVRISIIQSVPLLGDWIARMLQGGPRTGIVALNRFYILHILFLPGLLAALVAFHLHMLYHKGLSESLSQDGAGLIRCSALNMLTRWLVLLGVTTVLLGLAAWQWPAPFGDPADPTDSSYVPKPEWWVLFLNQLVAIFRGPAAVLGSTIIPGLLAAGLVFLPWLDKAEQRNPGRRKAVLVCAGCIGLSLLVLSGLGYVEHFGHGARLE